jgi:hypothetical protein
MLGSFLTIIQTELFISTVIIFKGIFKSVIIIIFKNIYYLKIY